jgi:hypothetical protein
VFDGNDARRTLARFLALLHFGKFIPSAFCPQGGEGVHFCPTFEDAVTRHRMLDAIETAVATGQRQMLG